MDLNFAQGCGEGLFAPELEEARYTREKEHVVVVDGRDGGSRVYVVEADVMEIGQMDHEDPSLVTCFESS